MKNILILLSLAIIITLIGCSKDDVISNSPTTDNEAIQQMVTSVDSIAEFLEEDETSINDDGALDWAKMGYNEPLTAIKVLKWGRRITKIEKTTTVTTVDDTTAIALVTKIVTGNFVISAAYSDTAHSADTVILKPFQEQLQRKVIFKRINNSNDIRLNWRPVALSLTAGNTIPDSLNAFTIEQLEVYAPADTYYVTNPLETWLRLGALRHRVPQVSHNDSLVIRMTLLSNNDSAEIVALRWAGEMKHSRLKMRLVNSTPTANGQERTYELRIKAVLPQGKMIGRCNIVTDVFSWGSLKDDSQSVSNRIWGFPYDIRRRDRN